MPQLVALGRRWRVATDATLPIVCLLFCFFHVAIVIPIFVVFVAGSSNYPCDQEALVKASILTTLGLNLVAMIHDATFVVVGWRGGPLEEHKRRHAKYLVGSRVLLYVITIAVLVFSTVLVYLPSIQRTCYVGNPCRTNELQLREDACVDGRLTEPCAFVYNTPVDAILPCRTEWFNLAASFAVAKYEPSRVPHYSGLPYSPTNDSSLCEVTFEAAGEAFARWQNETGQTFPPYNPGISPLDINADARTLGDYWANIMGYTGVDVPWDQCLAGSYCYELAMAINDCPLYNDLLLYGNDSSDYTYALAAVWGSWGIMMVNVLIILAAFNAFPDYDNKESWKESVKGAARLMCCSKVLNHAKTEDGQDAAAGLGDLLFKLFGGIDLDYTDLLLGLYLVSERQSWRRFLYAKGRIEKLGRRVFVPKEKLTKAATAAMPTNDERACDDVEFEDDDTNALSFRRSVLDTNMATKKSSEQSETRRTARVVVAYDRRPFLTPFDFTPLGTFDPAIDAHDRLSIYVNGDATPEGQDHGNPTASSLELVRSCVDLVWFAKASYGLQTKKWKDSQQEFMIDELTDKCLACTPFLGNRAVTRNHFTKRNFASILRFTKVAAADVLHVSYTSTALGVIPYLVVLDRRANRVVLSVRGTTEISDVVTDLLGHPQDCSKLMPTWVHDSNVNKSPLQIHSGILSSAVAVLRDLEANGILEALETTVEMPLSSSATTRSEDMVDILHDRDDVQDAFDALHPDDEVELPIERAHSILAEAAKRDIPLVVTGHSLGAAVASVCAFKLKERFPSMRCVCFNPPGGVMSKTLSELSETFCTSFLVGSDIISRLNLQNMSQLVDDMVLALARCKKPKLTVLLEILMGRRRFRSNADTYYAADEISDEVLDILQRYIDTSALHGETIRQGGCNLLPPGKALFLRPVDKITGGRGGDGRDQEHEAGWDVVAVDKEALLEEGILLTADAIDHHHLSLTHSAMLSCLSGQNQNEDFISE